ncbi:MAG: hypothetical protein L6W00_08095 [Lentisphaeria bacterium]|nr:MAG: hypothetical protein L6W00_08095 [Lentisphaeria bacterium]
MEPNGSAPSENARATAEKPNPLFIKHSYDEPPESGGVAVHRINAGERKNIVEDGEFFL